MVSPGFARSSFVLDPAWTFLNHGSFGAMPGPIREAWARWRDTIESQPVAFLGRMWWDAVANARSEAATFLGARPSDVVFVQNATSGVQAVVNSIRLAPGDELLTTSHRYDAVRKILERHAHHHGAAVVELPLGTEDGSNNVGAALVKQLANAITSRTRLVVVDAITSPSALVLPVEEVVAIARSAGVPVLVDGAHAPGHLDVNLQELGADYWVGNLHKWICAPRGTAVLFVDEQHQNDVSPVVTSHGYGMGFQLAFDWPGTFDASAWLTTPAALALHDAWGGPDLRASNLALARHYRARLFQTLGLPLPATPPASWDCAMVTVPLGRAPGQHQAVQAWLADQRIEAPIIPHDGQLFVRVSAFAPFNTEDDIEHLCARLPELLRTFAPVDE